MDEARVRATLSIHLAAVRERIARAAGRAGRDPSGVRLVAITKTAPPDLAAALVGLGVEDLGESRVQRLETVAAALEGRGLRPRWHMVGHLQRNKARACLNRASALHSLDSERLLEALAVEIEAGRGPSRLQVFVEVNVGGEPQKGGVGEAELFPLLARLGARAAVLEPLGLMTMAPAAGDKAAVDRLARPVFRRLRELLEEARARVPGLAPFDRLSMGMSGDLEIAVEEGATDVRVGSALFTGLL